MPLTTPQVISLDKLLLANRADWIDHQAAVHSACRTLAEDPRPWPVLLKQAIDQSAVARNRFPICVTWPLPDQMQAPAGSSGTSGRGFRRPTGVGPCEIHGGRELDSSGDYRCCATGRTSDRANIEGAK